MPKQSQESSRKCGHFLVALAELAAVYGLGRVVDSRVWFNSIQAHSFTGYLPVFSSGNGLKGTFFFLLSAAPNFKGPVATATVYPPRVYRRPPFGKHFSLVPRAKKEHPTVRGPMAALGVIGPQPALFPAPKMAPILSPVGRQLVPV